MSKDLPLTERKWIVRDGSIYTEGTKDVYVDVVRKTFKTQPAIAFNIGDKHANHIVELHNRSLQNLSEYD